MSKYIIKNCPYNSEDETLDGYENMTDCQNITDCLLKQIVELCKGIKCPCEFKGADCWECTESGAKRLADRILQLLNVQEVE